MADVVVVAAAAVVERDKMPTDRGWTADEQAEAARLEGRQRTVPRELVNGIADEPAPSDPVDTLVVAAVVDSVGMGDIGRTVLEVVGHNMPEGHMRFATVME